MRSQRRKQIITVSVLLVAVVTLSIGFAAFSNTLVIQSSLSVNPDTSNFSVVFSSNPTTLETNEVEPSSKTSGLTANNGIIDNSGLPTISDLSVKFKNPGEYVEYKFYARNIGAYTAYLTGIIYENISGTNLPKQCEVGEGTNEELVNNACNAINMSITVGGLETIGTKLSITDHLLAKESAEEVVIRIEYDSAGARADGPFSVSFGDIYLTYSTVEGELVSNPSNSDETYNEISGSNAIALSGTGNSLKNYRIYGSSSGVGDKSKNLLNPDEAIIAGIAGANGNTYNNTKQVTTGYAAVDGSTDYYFNIDTSVMTNCTPAFYDANKNFLKLGSLDMSTGKFTTTEDTAYVRVRINHPNSVDYTEQEFNAVKNVLMLSVYSNDNSYVPYNQYDIPITIRGKNLLKVSQVSNQNLGGVTMSVDENGLFHLNGTVDTVAVWSQQSNLAINNPNFKTFIESGSVTGSNSTIYLKTSDGKYLTNYLTDQYKQSMAGEFSLVNLYLTVRVGDVFNDLVFGVVLEENSVPTSYEPYVEPVSYVINLSNPLMEGDYIDFETQSVVRSDGTLEHISMPTINTLNATTVIDVETMNAPSKVEAIYIK